MKALSDCSLYAFVDTAYLNGRTPESLASELCRGGADIIQLRAKNLSKAEVRQMGERIEPITSGHGVWLVINDYPDVATEVGAPLCHLGQEDFFDAGHLHVSDLRMEPVKIGLSSHAPAQAERAIAAGADYIAIGPVWPTATKPSAKPVTLDYVRWASANVKIPWFAIGGITLQNISEVLASGATRICVVSAILNSADSAKTCKEFKDRLTSARR
ncbi:MAG TPA: thiamine phosphate synthase [Candidatus Saccharimonadales bacterium]|nr:thiamine phosphate synthase [Candidatus Saccharimonadales bacterium]